MNTIYINTAGGLGNKLFFLLAGISFSIDYNLELIINNYKSKEHGKSIKNFVLFNKFKIIDSKINMNNLEIIKQKEFYYEKILLKNNINYIINASASGYFQSYKYFWHNKDKIKEYFNINNEKFNILRDNINNLGSHIAIHIRLKDYINSQFINLSADYYKEILDNFDLEKYKVLIFSDDPVKAISIIKNLYSEKNINIINIENFSKDDEEQFMMLCYTNIRICANSTFSLLSCYFNEIYNFNEQSTYYFPSKWFNEGKENYKIEDLIITENKKFKLINKL